MSASQSGNTTPSATTAPASSVREHAPKLPEPQARTGDRTVDTLLDLRDHVAQAAHEVDAAREAAASIDPDTLADDVSARVTGTVKGEAQDVAARAAAAAKDAKTAAERARQTAEATPTAREKWLAAGFVAAAVLLAAMGGWIVREHALLGGFPTCNGPAFTAEDGAVRCFIREGTD